MGKVRIAGDRVAWGALRRHHLAEPAGTGDLARVADDIVGLHATSATSPYLSLHARVRSFRSEQLDEALYVGRSLVRIKGMRGTVFVVSRQLAPIVFAATQRELVARDQRWLKLDHAVYARLGPEVLRALAGRALNTAELRQELGAGSDISSVVALLCDEGRIVRDQPVGSRRSTAFRYRLWQEALAQVDLTSHDEAEATRLLVHHYLASYGPATFGDIVWWSGIPAPRIRDALAGLGEGIVEVEVDDPLGQFWWTRDAIESMPEAQAISKRRVNLVPELDPYVMGYRDRERYLDPRHRELVFDRGGNATSVVLVDGRITGIWDLIDSPEPTVRYLVFEAARACLDQIEEQAAMVGRFWFGQAPTLIECASMTPLTERSGVIRRPLDGAEQVRRRYL